MPDASVSIVNGWEKSGRVSTRADVTAVFSLIKAAAESEFQMKFSFFKRSVRGLANRAYCLINFLSYPPSHKNPRYCFTVVGIGQWRMASTLELSICTPLEDTTWPRYLTWWTPKVHFEYFAKRCCCCRVNKTCSKCYRWVSQLVLKTRMS